MPAKRIIPCLDVDAGRVVKGVRFVELRDAGDPVELAPAYDRAGADELVFLDITASAERVAGVVVIPIRVGLPDVDLRANYGRTTPRHDKAEELEPRPRHVRGDERVTLGRACLEVRTLGRRGRRLRGRLAGRWNEDVFPVRPCS